MFHVNEAQENNLNDVDCLQILLVHEASKGSFSRVFDFEANDDLNEEGESPRTSPFESRFPINIGITGHVAATGEVCRYLIESSNL